jgi:aryl-alcohol dehydrogenase-like predicted oxidoreductase
LGSTGFDVSAVGHGTWGLGGDFWRGVDSRDAQRALYVALDSGVTMVDTALVYGDGNSERLVGEVIRDQRARDWAVVATKIPPKNFVWPAVADVPIHDVFPTDYVVDCVERSLRNLKAEVLGVEQLHVWNDAWLGTQGWADLQGAMQLLIKQGKVLHWGVSVNDHDPKSAIGVAADPLIEVLQVIYNIFDPTPAAELFAVAKEHDVGVIARVPLDEGGLTGALHAESEFPPRDWRNRYFRDDRLTQLVARTDALAELLGDEAQSLPELALRFCLSAPEVSTVIPGMRREAHVRANIASGDGRGLSPDLLARLAGHAWDRNWYR